MNERPVAAEPRSRWSTVTSRALSTVALDRWWRETGCGTAEALYAIAVLLGLTLGPVYQVRVQHFGLLKADFLDDSMVQLTFAAGYAVAVALLARRWTTWSGRRAVITLAVLLPLAVFLSTAWSLERNRTFGQGVLLFGTTVFALYLADRYEDGQLVVLIFGALHVGAALSTIVLVRHWNGARDPLGQWTGIYFNRNSLGPVAGLGVATGMLLLHRAVSTRRPLAAVGVLACVLMDGVLLAGSRSATSIGGLGAFVTVAAVGAVATRAARQRSWSAGRTAAVAIVPLGAVAIAAVAARAAIFRVLGKNSTLEGRVPLWKLVWGWIRVHPVRGSGFMSIWNRPDYQEQVQNKLFTHEPSAHNGYLEVVLGLGFVGGLLLLALVGVMVARVLRAAWRRPGVPGVWRVAIVTYVLVVNLQESFIGPNLLVWVLALAAAMAPTPPALTTPPAALG